MLLGVLACSRDGTSMCLSRVCDILSQTLWAMAALTCVAQLHFSTNWERVIGSAACIAAVAALGSYKNSMVTSSSLRIFNSIITLTQMVYKLRQAVLDLIRMVSQILENQVQRLIIWNRQKDWLYLQQMILLLFHLLSFLQ